MNSTTSTGAAPLWTHDVFLSFRGEDTRNNFTGHLYNYLDHKGIRTFMDAEKLRTGEELSPALHKAIQESKLSVIVFSENYASSKWCMEELGKILECRESRKQMVFPIFHKVDPSNVRNQRGSFAEAFAEHEGNFAINKEKVLKWRTNLTEAASLVGSTFSDGDDESKFIAGIVKKISEQVLNRTYFDVAAYPIGIESRVQDVHRLLGVGGTDVRMVGIWGTGGIGKTTIAKAVYNSIAHEFEGRCFLANVRERSTLQEGLVELQKTLLFDILGEKELMVTSVDRGITVIRERLRHKRVVLILDDVSKVEQLEKLVGSIDWFGSGSRVIITTRDKDLLIDHQVASIYTVPKLDDCQALELLTWNAFKQDRNYLDDDNVKLIVGTAVNYAQGLPLALTVLGKLVCGKSVDEWDEILDSLRREPSEEIQNVLKISYYALRSSEQRVFLDIACFFKGCKKEYVIQIQKGSVRHPKLDIDALMAKALITIDEFNNIWMHDLLEDIGKDLVRQDSEGLSRLWLFDDVEHVFTNNLGTNKIEGIIVYSRKARGICLTAQSFVEMKKLRIFINCNRIAQFSGDIDQFVLPNALVLLHWPKYPFQSLPSNFCPKNLTVLNMPCASISRLWDGFKCFTKLTYMDLNQCYSLTKTPDFSGLQNLVELSLELCTSLVEIDDSIGSLTKLATLNLRGCSNLAIFPIKVYWKSIKSLNFARCGRLKNFPEFQEKNESLLALDLSCTGIKEVPSSIANLTVLQRLFMDWCPNLTTLPRSLYSLQHVEWICLCGCSKLVAFPQDKDAGSLALPGLRFLALSGCSNLSDTNFLETLDCKGTLKELWLDGSKIVSLPSCMRQFVRLQFLNLRCCKKLREIPMLPCRVRWLDASNCASLERLSNLSDFFEGGNSQMIRYINLSGCNCRRLNRFLEYSMARKNNILRSLSFQRSPFKVMLSGDEAPQWFDHHKRFQVPEWLGFWEVLGQECEFSFELPPKSELESCGLALYVAVKRKDQYKYDIPTDAQTRILINGVFVNDMDEDNVLDTSGVSINGKLLLSYVPLRRYMHPGVRSSDNNTCRVKVVLNSWWCLKSCGVHLVTPQKESAVSKSKQVKDDDAGGEELMEDDDFSEAGDDREKACEEAMFSARLDDSIRPKFAGKQYWNWKSARSVY